MPLANCTTGSMKPQTALDQTSESEFEQTNQTLITLIAGFIQVLNVAKEEASLIVLGFTILCPAVHVIISFLVSYSFLFFLYLFLGIVSCLGETK